MFSYTVKLCQKPNFIVSSEVFVRSLPVHRSYSPIFSHLFFLSFPRMLAQSDSEQITARNTVPCLPSSVLMPMLTTPLQGDMVNPKSAGGSQDADLMRYFKPSRSLKKTNSNRFNFCHFECLVCGCLPKSSKDLSDAPQTLNDQQRHQSRFQMASGVSLCFESRNNNMLPGLSENDAHKGRGTPRSKDDEKSHSPFPLWSPFSRLRCYLAKRRRRNGATNSDGLTAVIDMPNKDAAGGSRSPQLEKDLREQVYLLIFLEYVSTS